jgi:hypothetical protein
MTDNEKERLIDLLCIRVWNLVIRNLSDWLMQGEYH